MTKKDLERRNQFLLLQLKIINELTEECIGKSRDEIFEFLGSIAHYASPETIKKDINFIETYNESYNFFNKTMNIKEYE